MTGRRQHVRSLLVKLVEVVVITVPMMAVCFLTPILWGICTGQLM